MKNSESKELDLQTKCILANYLLKKYCEEIQKRDDFVFPVLKTVFDRDDKIYLGDGRHFYLRDLIYYINNEKWIVASAIRFHNKAYMSLPNFERSNNVISVVIELLREREDGGYERITRCIKDCSRSSDVKQVSSIYCYLDYLFYVNTDNVNYYVNTERLKRGRYVDKAEYDEVTKMMVDPKVIEEIYDLINSKIKLTLFDETNTKKADGYELGNWPQNEIKLDIDEMVNGQKNGNVR